MSWNSRSYDKKQIQFWTHDPQGEPCEHVAAGEEGVALLKEDDSFGPVLRVVVCCACLDEADRAEAERVDTCDDCHALKPMSEIQEWRWYDFYAPQGDEPLLICDACRELPKHQERVRRDRAEREEEARQYAGYDDGDDDHCSDPSSWDDADDDEGGADDGDEEAAPPPSDDGGSPDTHETEEEP